MNENIGHHNLSQDKVTAISSTHNFYDFHTIGRLCSIGASKSEVISDSAVVSQPVKGSKEK